MSLDEYKERVARNLHLVYLSGPLDITLTVADD